MLKTAIKDARTKIFFIFKVIDGEQLLTKIICFLTLRPNCPKTGGAISPIIGANYSAIRWHDRAIRRALRGDFGGLSGPANQLYPQP